MSSLSRFVSSPSQMKCSSDSFFTTALQTLRVLLSFPFQDFTVIRKKDMKEKDTRNGVKIPCPLTAVKIS